jgi:hypothetical protein
MGFMLAVTRSSTRSATVFSGAPMLLALKSSGLSSGMGAT